VASDSLCYLPLASRASWLPRHPANLLATNQSYRSYHPPVEVDVASHRLPCVLRLVVAQLLVFCENKEPLPPHTTLLDQPAWTRGDRWMEGGRRVRRTKNGERRMEER